MIGAVGRDWDDYNSWLTRHGVDTSSVKVSRTQLTASFTVTTDKELNQIASFYPGAMSEARDIELGPIIDKYGGVDLVVILQITQMQWCAIRKSAAIGVLILRQTLHNN